MGHQVRLLPPHEVRSYVHRSKTDRADAAALLEALRNERQMRGSIVMRSSRLIFER